MTEKEFGKRTLLAPSPEMRGRAERERQIKAADETYRKDWVEMVKEFGELHYHEKMGFGKKYVAGIDPYNIGGKSHASIVILKDNRIIYRATYKLWKVKLSIWIAKFLGIKIIMETNESKK